MVARSFSISQTERCVVLTNPERKGWVEQLRPAAQRHSFLPTKETETLIRTPNRVAPDRHCSNYSKDYAAGMISSCPALILSGLPGFGFCNLHVFLRIAIKLLADFRAHTTEAELKLAIS